LHTYFAVSNILDAAVTGLDGCDFIDRVGGDSRGRQSGVVAFARETDRIYLDTPSGCSIEDPGWRRRILIETSNSRSTVVWNPWVEKAAKLGDMGETGYLGMVCVESGNAAANTLTLNAGDEHCLQARYSVESLP
jgi:D-hexose-6-phosphate mutarotase